MLRGVDNFLEVGGLKTEHMKFLHYHAHFCMTTPTYYNVCQKIWFSPPNPPIYTFDAGTDVCRLDAALV